MITLGHFLVWGLLVIATGLTITGFFHGLELLIIGYVLTTLFVFFMDG